MFGGSTYRAVAADAAVLCLATRTGNPNNEAASTDISTGATVEPAGAMSSGSGTPSAEPTQTGGTLTSVPGWHSRRWT